MNNNIIGILEDYNTNLLPPESASVVNDYPEATLISSDENNTDIQLSIKPNLQSFNNDTNSDSSTDIIFKPTETIRKWTNITDIFSFIQCPIITTYYSDPIPYSQLTNPSTIENNPEYNLKFLLRGNNKEYIGDSFQLLPTFMLDTITNEELNNFIYALNNLYRDDSNIEITNTNVRYKKKLGRILLLLIIIALCICLGFGCYYFTNLYEERTINYWIVITMFSCFLLLIIYLIITVKRKLRNADYQLMEEMITYRIKCDEKIKAFIEEWNMKMFHMKNIDMWLPITLEYVMFNMNKNQRIVLKHHPLGILYNI